MQTENWDDFRYVLAVIEHGSLSAAARVLGVNHATVLRRVNGFQEKFGQKVFDRDAKGYRVRPDQAGLVAALSDLRNAFETTERAMLGHGAGIRGPVKITSTDSLCISVLPLFVAALRLEHPELLIEVLASNNRLNFGQLDAEVTIRPTQELPDDLVGTRVGKLAFAVYAHPDYLSGIKDHSKLQWLKCSGPLSRSPAGTWQQENIPPHMLNCAADSFVSLRHLCLAGLGLAILPCCLVDESSNLNHVPGYFEKMYVPLWVANHRDLDGVARIVACREFLVHQMEQHADLLQGRPKAC